MPEPAAPTAPASDPAAARVPRLHPSWLARVGEHLQSPSMRALSEFLRAEKAAGQRVYPPGPEIFAALDATPFEQVKVVVLGQDPYHGPGQAHGLCFSVRPGVRAGQPGSHQNRGWEGFTDHVVETLSREREGLVFLLWGSYAQAKAKVVDARRHCLLRAPHPSPLSAHRGFIGCGHFSATNRWLAGRGLAPVDWRLPPASTLTD
jgi:uracil-DNA glycosylase